MLGIVIACCLVTRFCCSLEYSALFWLPAKSLVVSWTPSQLYQGVERLVFKASGSYGARSLVLC